MQVNAGVSDVSPPLDELKNKPLRTEGGNSFHVRQEFSEGGIARDKINRVCVRVHYLPGIFKIIIFLKNHQNLCPIRAREGAENE